MLDGLLDIRLWSRLGAGHNYDSLQQHSWFEEQKLVWSDVVTRKERPEFVPNVDRITREMQFKHGNDDFYSEFETTTTLSLCTREEAILKEFYFIAKKYEPTVKDEVIVHVNSKDSITGSEPNIEIPTNTDDAVSGIADVITLTSTTDARSESEKCSNEMLIPDQGKLTRHKLRSKLKLKQDGTATVTRLRGEMRLR